MKKKFTLVMGILLLLTICGCSAQSDSSPSALASETESAAAESSNEVQQASQDVFAMDTYMTVTAYGDAAQDAVDKAVAEIESLDALLSTGVESSEIAQINANGESTVSSDTAYLIERSLELYESTDGVFNIAIYPIMKAWGFADQNFRVPSEDELKELLKLADASKINYDKDKNTISFNLDGMMIDLGGIAKGYTSTKIMDIFRECGVESGMVNLGGNAQVYGYKTDGSEWRVAIESPDEEGGSGGILGVLSTHDKAVITSGGYERYFEQDGVTYHHIIDPETGSPANNGLISVSIVTADGTLADGLSTSLYIMGKDKAIEYWKAHSDEFDMILETDDHKLFISEGISDSFSTEMEMEIVKKG